MLVSQLRSHRKRKRKNAVSAGSGVCGRCPGPPVGAVRAEDRLRSHRPRGPTCRPSPACPLSSLTPSGEPTGARCFPARRRGLCSLEAEARAVRAAQAAAEPPGPRRGVCGTAFSGRKRPHSGPQAHAGPLPASGSRPETADRALRRPTPGRPWPPRPCLVPTWTSGSSVTF